MSLLDFYYKLASDSPNERIEAAVGLLEGLAKADSAEDWDYALNRLIKGLSSSRDSSRLGFSMALAELLRAREEHISVSQILDMITDHFKVPGNASGHEERGLLFGKLFGLQTLAQSPLLTNSSIQEYEWFVDALLSLASAKVWLRESAMFALCEVVPKVLEAPNFNGNKALGLTLQMVHDNGLTCTSEGCALYLSIPSEVRSAYGSLLNGWKESDPLAKGNLGVLSKALRETASPQEDKQIKQANWKPSLHFVWSKLVHQLSSSQDHTHSEVCHKNKKRKTEKKSKKEEVSSSSLPERVHLDDFWKTVVDESLFANSSSSEKKFWGFEIFLLFIRNVDAKQIPTLFSPNFLRCLTNQLGQPDRMLNKAAKRTISVVNEVASADKNKALAILQKVLEKVPDFDRLTKTKTVEQLLQVIDNSQLESIVTLFVDIFKHPHETDAKAIDNRRQWTVDSLLGLVKNHKNAEDIKWTEHIVEFLIQNGYFVNRKLELSDHIVEICRSRMNSVMSLIVSKKRPDNVSWAYYAFDRIINLEKSGYELLIQFDGEVLNAKDKAVKTLRKINKKRTSSPHVDHSSQLEAFELLFSLVLIQVYSTDSESVSILDELQLCYNTILGKAKIEEGADTDEAMDAIQVLTEILLSLLSRNSALLRKLSETVWETFSSQITEESLQLLYDVLETPETKQGQESLFDNDDDMDVDEEGDDEEEGEEKERASEDGNASGKEDEEDVSGESDSDELNEADRKAQEALAEALGIAGAHPQGSSDDDEESMDDEQMMALDEQLAIIFRERQKALSSGQQKRTEIKQAQKNMVDFKARILDLLDIYVKNEANSERTNGLVLTAIIPLLALIRTTRNKHIGDKAHQILKVRLCKARHVPGLDEERVRSALDCLEQVHSQAQRSKSKAHSLACNQCSVFLTKVLLSHDKHLSGEIVKVYSSSLQDFIDKPNSKLTAALFFDLVNYISSVKRS